MEASHFHQELEQLRLKVIHMAALTERALANALESLFQRNSELAGEVIGNDQHINSLELEIDRIVLKLLALDQPMARDLRFILGSMRACVNLERLADQAVNIAERALYLNQRAPLPHQPAVEQLATTSMDMLKTAISAFINQNPVQAEEVCRMDNEADELNVKILRHFIDYMVSEVRAVERAVHTIIIARCLERTGDLSTNIAEAVIFIVDGVNVKHHCQE
ncbi:MAG: phosphate signaling complex protein PhoU [Syntrophobacteria bacterium]